MVILLSSKKSPERLLRTNIVNFILAFVNPNKYKKMVTACPCKI